MNKHCTNQILQFAIKQTYDLTLINRLNETDIEKVVLTYYYGQIIGTINFSFIHSVFSNTNSDNLGLAGKQSVKFYLDERERDGPISEIHWSHKQQCFYFKQDSSCLLLPTYLNEIIFVLLYHFSWNFKVKYNSNNKQLFIDKSNNLLKQLKQLNINIKYDNKVNKLEL